MYTCTMFLLLFFFLVHLFSTCLQIVIPDRTKHCKLCQACCTGFDHHCMWLTSCIGYNNHRLFVVFLMVLVTINSTYLWDSFRRESLPRSLWREGGRGREGGRWGDLVRCGHYESDVGTVYVLKVNMKLSGHRNDAGVEGFLSISFCSKSSFSMMFQKNGCFCLKLIGVRT